MLNYEILYSYNDVTIIPNVLSMINSRSECNPFLENGKLPLFTAPMSSVVNEGNFNIFEDNGINAILPRNINIETRLSYSKKGKWAAYSLQEFEQYFCCESPAHDTWRALIDVANGHMDKLYYLVELAKSMNDIEVMIGNIANPDTIKECCNSGVDYVRVGIGGGAGCITSSNTGIHCPMASLIDKCWLAREEVCGNTKIIADGGIRNYSDVIKALALGADYVMIGSLFAQCMESAAPKVYDDNEPFYPQFFKEMTYINNEWHCTPNSRGLMYGWFKKEVFPEILIDFYGMASAKGQCEISGSKTKTSEGISKSLPVLYTIKGWTENMIAYMRSAMSYCDINYIKNFNPNTVSVYIMSTEAKNSINK